MPVKKTKKKQPKTEPVLCPLNKKDCYSYEDGKCLHKAVNLLQVRKFKHCKYYKGK